MIITNEKFTLFSRFSYPEQLTEAIMVTCLAQGHISSSCTYLILPGGVKPILRVKIAAIHIGESLKCLYECEQVIY